MTLACFDGAVVDAEQARLPVTDDGLLRGDGVFEVIRLYDGLPFALDEHLERMALSASRLLLGLDVADIGGDVAKLLEASGARDGMIRVLATRGGHRVALHEPLPARPATMSLALVEYAPTRLLDGIKSLSYAANMLANRLAVERGFDEALFVTPHGRLLEGPGSSVFVVMAGELRTPPLSDHILDSITRRRVLEVCAVQETPIARDDLHEATAAFLVSTLREGTPLHRIEDHELDVSDPVLVEAVARTRGRIAAEVAAAAARVR